MKPIAIEVEPSCLVGKTSRIIYNHLNLILQIMASDHVHVICFERPAHNIPHVRRQDLGHRRTSHLSQGLHMCCRKAQDSHCFTWRLGSALGASGCRMADAETACQISLAFHRQQDGGLLKSLLSYSYQADPSCINKPWFLFLMMAYDGV